MWGWVRRAAMSISRRNRSFPRAAPRSGLSTLRATRRRCFRSSARYTVAMPPRPSSRLITLDANAIKELPHQIDVAQRVLRDMGGRAILADEVGLGKTIEASIIYKELAIRGLARRALILTPASLVGQWQGELEEKFFERFDTPTDPADWPRVTKAIISHDRARTRRHAEEILRHRWDLVIVDEAHKVKSHRGATYQFIEKIERDFILLLTATPLQNDLRELYNR